MFCYYLSMRCDTHICHINLVSPRNEFIFMINTHSVRILSDYDRDLFCHTAVLCHSITQNTVVGCHVAVPDTRTHTLRIAKNSPCIAIDRSTELKLFAEYSLSELLNRLPFRNGPLPRLMRFCDKCSPHKFEPPCVYGMFSNAMPCKCGPLAKSNETPSHCVHR